MTAIFENQYLPIEGCDMKEDKRFNKTLDQQRNRQKGEAFTRYYDLMGVSFKLVEKYRVFIADMHVQRLENRFGGLERLKDAINELEDAQRSLKVWMGEIETNEK